MKTETITAAPTIGQQRLVLLGRIGGQDCHADEARELGIKIGDTITGREKYPDGWNEVELTLVWLGDQVAVYRKRWRGHYLPDKWNDTGETASFTLSCREWYLKQNSQEWARGASPASTCSPDPASLKPASAEPPSSSPPSASASRP